MGFGPSVPIINNFMKASGAKILLWIGVIWVAADVIWGGVTFLAGNPHYFSSGDGLAKAALYGNVIGFLILIIPGVILILIAKRKLKDKQKS